MAIGLGSFELIYAGVPGYWSNMDLITYMSNRKWMVAEIFIMYVAFLVLKIKFGNEPVLVNG